MLSKMASNITLVSHRVSQKKFIILFPAQCYRFFVAAAALQFLPRSRSVWANPLRVQIKVGMSFCCRDSSTALAFTSHTPSEIHSANSPR